MILYMDEKVNHKSEYRCKLCDKLYASANSLCNHNKKFHSEINNCLTTNNNSTTTNNNLSITNNNLLTTTISVGNTSKIHSCKYCNKVYNIQQSKWKHEQTCKKIYDLEKQKQDQELLLKIKEQEKEILKLKLKLERSKKADVVTLKQLNKLLLERKEEYQNYINNNGTIYNGSNVQNIVNNIQLIGFGKEEDIVETLTNKEKKLIIDSRYKCLEKFIEIVHCGKYDKFKNIIVTNIKDNYMYRFDESKSQFVLATKDETIKCLIDNRMYDLETLSFF